MTFRVDLKRWVESRKEQVGSPDQGIIPMIEKVLLSDYPRELGFEYLKRDNSSCITPKSTDILKKNIQSRNNF